MREKLTRESQPPIFLASRSHLLRSRSVNRVEAWMGAFFHCVRSIVLRVSRTDRVADR